MTNLRTWLSLIVLAAMGATACSGGAAQVSSPIGPTPITVSAGTAAGGSASVDVVRSGGGLRSRQVATWAANHGWATTNLGLEVEGSDVVTAVSGVCPSIVLTVRDIPVTVNATTEFQGGISCASLAQGQRVNVRGILTIVGGAISVLATRIHVEDGHGLPGARVEVEGHVASVTGSCPALTITLRGVAGSVVTNAATVFSSADSCARIAVGTEIEAKGLLTDSRQLTATELEIENDDDEADERRVEGEGRVTSLQGVCPALTFVVRGFTVRTTADTEFKGGRCQTIERGTNVEVRGVRNGDAIIAERVEIEDDDDDE